MDDRTMPPLLQALEHQNRDITIPDIKSDVSFRSNREMKDDIRYNSNDMD